LIRQLRFGGAAWSVKKWRMNAANRLYRHLRYIDTSAIRDGKLEQLRKAMKGLATFVEANVPQLIS
jgi:hypothetical protein